mmetsp:Transcript_16886/g.14805  ORF Transcript_16886/g.14805 Transcript_16886/m.14805 type:complete len:226 (+) Transcript_16886:57-734(+)
MEFTRPLDTLIDKFDFVNMKISSVDVNLPSPHKNSTTHQKLIHNTSSDEYKNIALDLWHESVEIENPGYFNLTEEDLKEIEAIPGGLAYKFQTQTTLDAQLYDTSLDYLLLIIQKFAQAKLPIGKEREHLYEIFTSIEPSIISHLDQAISFNSELGLVKNTVSLKNVKRNVKYHFTSVDVKKLIITGDIKQNYSKVHEVTRIPLYIHMVAAIICLSLSSFFHLFT